MKVVTYNARYDNQYDGVNRFEYRKPFILEKLAQEDPDIIGFQEVLPHMLVWMKKELKSYMVVGCGRGAELDGETAVVAYKRDRFNIIQMETFWLSPTPLVPGSRYKQQSDCPRTCTVVLLHDLYTGKVFRVYNTHLDHEGEEARVLGMTQILNKMKEQVLFPEAPVIFMGDFNAEPMAKEIRLCEQMTDLKEFTESIGGTFHDYGRRVPNSKIDYIFVSPTFKLIRADMWTDRKGELYLSDHYPVCIEIE